MIIRSSIRATPVCVVAILLGGCAWHRPPVSTAESTNAAKSPSDDDAAKAAIPYAPRPKETREAYLKRLKTLGATPASQMASANVAPSIESRTPLLASALLRLQAMPTAENNRLVGEAYRQIGVLDTADRYLSRAIELDPSDARALDDRARIWRDSGYPGQGLGDAYRAIYKAPDSPEAYNTLGTLLQALGQHAEARATYERALALDNHAAYVLNNLCYLSLLDGHGDMAVGECRSALFLTPDATAIRNNLGLAYASVGDLDSARHQFSTGDDSGSDAYNIGIVEFASGHYAEAAEAFQTAYEANPNRRGAKEHAGQARKLAEQHALTETQNDDDRR